MPGYLQNLASRIAATRAVVHPRVPSRFEPVRPVPRAEAFTPAEDAREAVGAPQLDPAPPVPHPMSAALKSTRAFDRLAASDRQSARDEKKEPSATYPGIPKRSAESQATAFIPMTPRRSLPLSVSIPAAAQSDPPGKALGAGLRPSDSRPGDLADRSVARPNQATLPILQEPVGRTSSGLESQTIPARAPTISFERKRSDFKPAGVSETAVNVPQFIVPPKVLPDTEGSGLRSIDTARSHQDIHIVIGKVTVQTPAPAPVVARPAAPHSAPKLTLEQYLRERETNR
jgi:hypothetical protein